MNYFAHGLRHLDRPWFLAGTAVPDWLSVADRQVRLRPQALERFVPESAAERELAAGVLQHFEDDLWFHRSPGFVEVSRDLTERLRSFLDPSAGHRLSFFAHIATEVLLDSALIERDAERLDRYYSQLARVDPAELEGIVNRMAPRSTGRLARFIDRFRSVEFLRDYVDDARLVVRLNQVMRRARLEALPESVEEVLRSARSTVRSRVPDLLPPQIAAATAPVR